MSLLVLTLARSWPSAAVSSFQTLHSEKTKKKTVFFIPFFKILIKFNWKCANCALIPPVAQAQIFRGDSMPASIVYVTT